MTKRKKLIDRTPRAVDGGVITTCSGCGLTPISTKWLMPCPRCGVLVCRTCAEDKPHVLSESKMCELPPGQLPVTYEPIPGAINRFEKNDDGTFISLVGKRDG